jgi:iron(III) transport system ATP-binding protein
MRFELQRLQREFNLTTVYVTHDQNEALSLSHEIAVMSEGRIVQIGSPREIYEKPRNRFVADFVGTANFIDATVTGPSGEPDQYCAQTALGVLRCHAVEQLANGDKILISLRPEDVHVSAARPDMANVLEATVANRVFLGDYLEFQVRLGETALISHGHPSYAPNVGTRVFLGIAPEKCIAIPGAQNNPKH